MWRSAVEEQSLDHQRDHANLAEAARGGVAISKSIAAVADAARSGATGVVETQKSAEAVERMAEELHELLARFSMKPSERRLGFRAQPPSNVRQLASGFASRFTPHCFSLFRAGGTGTESFLSRGALCGVMEKSQSLDANFVTVTFLVFWPECDHTRAARPEPQAS